MCRAKNCQTLGCVEHYCRTCNVHNVAHRAIECKSTVRYPNESYILCNQIGCHACGIGSRHHCRNCHAINSHLTRFCPSIQQIGKSVHCLMSAPLHHPLTMYSVYGSHTGLVKYATMTVFYRTRSGEVRVIISLRGCQSKKNTFVTTGGSIDNGETAENCAIRECCEEHGIIISQSQIFHEHRSKIYSNFFAFIDHFDANMVHGPSSQHEWEITPTDFSNIRSLPNVREIWKGCKTRTALIFSVPVADLLASPLTSWSCMAPVCAHITSSMIHDPSLVVYIA
jgi:8-oxo-dGTP pyrophosphatase MutT (NUDIX family)